MSAKAVFCLLAAAAVHAQTNQIGLTAGIGGVGVDDGAGGEFAVAGAEGCFACSGRLGAFLEFSHLQRVGGTNGVRTFDLGAGGLRVQSKAKTVQPFFDVGFAAGMDRFRAGLAGRHSHVSAGLVLGGGATVWGNERWYVRPQVRAFALSGLHVVGVVALGVGVSLR
jgi:hypothetical protein